MTYTIKSVGGHVEVFDHRGEFVFRPIHVRRPWKIFAICVLDKSWAFFYNIFCEQTEQLRAQVRKRRV